MKTASQVPRKPAQLPLATALRRWPARRWVAAAGTAVLTYLVIAIPTDLIDTPLFIREIPPTWWSVPALIATAVLTGLLVATYVATTSGAHRGEQEGSDSERGEKDKGRFGAAGTIIAFFAVGCPVCNKLVLLALGTTGAVQYFEPLQPLLAVLSIGLLAWAFVKRAKSEDNCPIPAR
ncbi:hypothetical protein [Arthrobacter castelli]|uniref:hypothetical protein n=1 Tax=Arthrobacter castelli TaxID=271431 RepID=UPI0012DE911E|nr:hypothetical protein [Arthrobacter castelli]